MLPERSVLRHGDAAFRHVDLRPDVGILRRPRAETSVLDHDAAVFSVARSHDDLLVCQIFQNQVADPFRVLLLRLFLLLAVGNAVAIAVGVGRIGRSLCLLWFLCRRRIEARLQHIQIVLLAIRQALDEGRQRLVVVVRHVGQMTTSFSQRHGILNFRRWSRVWLLGEVPVSVGSARCDVLEVTFRVHLLWLQLGEVVHHLLAHRLLLLVLEWFCGRHALREPFDQLLFVLCGHRCRSNFFDALDGCCAYGYCVYGR
mmetsp:Transcript_18609/g.51749  ORF Transcript_18609/g.51749 Transcript_18609/m.51749 type:complete len:257 (+) Transcript_18609:1514-2284(+)